MFIMAKILAALSLLVISTWSDIQMSLPIEFAFPYDFFMKIRLIISLFDSEFSIAIIALSKWIYGFGYMDYGFW